MVESGWIFVGLILLAFLQLALFLYIRQRDFSTNPPKAETSGGANHANKQQNTTDRSRDSTENARACSVCGAINEPGFKFCWECAQQIGS